jgi:hypothetical protein
MMQGWADYVEGVLKVNKEDKKVVNIKSIKKLIK